MGYNFRKKGRGLWGNFHLELFVSIQSLFPGFTTLELRFCMFPRQKRGFLSTKLKKVIIHQNTPSELYNYWLTHLDTAGILID